MEYGVCTSVSGISVSHQTAVKVSVTFSHRQAM